MDQAWQSLQNRQPDNAINLLEQAVNLDPTNGQSYYYLAQAWLMKGDFRQALVFNQLAGIHVEADSVLASLVAEQKKQIELLAEDPY
jgi:cytochrome c-type biogenesis protein CcmH/NrfG